MLTKIVIGILIGGALGATMGYFGKCSTGACPLTATPWRGAMWGILLGVMFSLSFTSTARMTEPGAGVLISNGSVFEDKISNSKGLVMVDFYSDYCPPCVKLEPTIARIMEKYQDVVKVFKVNVRTQPELGQKVNLAGTPTVVLYRDGLELGRLVGLYDETDYIALIEKYAKMSDEEQKAL